MFETVALTAPALPADRPRYLMGVGKPADLIGAVARGIDLFDCVLPTRSGRTAQAWTAGGPLNLRNQRHADDPLPLEAGCPCPACRDHSRAYLHHLIKAGEILGAMLLTWHNLPLSRTDGAGAGCDRGAAAWPSWSGARPRSGWRRWRSPQSRAKRPPGLTAPARSP